MIAYFIAHHAEADPVFRLLSLLYTPDDLFLVSADAKMPEAEFARLSRLAALPNLIVRKGGYVDWATVSILDGTLDGMRLLLRAERRWDYFVLLSGVDVPVQTPAAIRRSLADSGANWVKTWLEVERHIPVARENDRLGREFSLDLPITENLANFGGRCRAFGGIGRYREIVLAPGMSNNLWLDEFQRFTKDYVSLPESNTLVVREPSTDLVRFRNLAFGQFPKLRRGSAWVALRRSFCEALQPSAKAVLLYEALRSCNAPDETYFQTLVRALGEPERNERITYDNMGKGMTLDGADDLAAARAENCLFARKVVPGKSDGFLRALARDLAPESAGWSLQAEWEGAADEGGLPDSLDFRERPLAVQMLDGTGLGSLTFLSDGRIAVSAEVERITGVAAPDWRWRRVGRKIRLTGPAGNWEVELCWFDSSATKLVVDWLRPPRPEYAHLILQGPGLAEFARVSAGMDPGPIRTWRLAENRASAQLLFAPSRLDGIISRPGDSFETLRDPRTGDAFLALTAGGARRLWQPGDLYGSKTSLLVQWVEAAAAVASELVPVAPLEAIESWRQRLVAEVKAASARASALAVRRTGAAAVSAAISFSNPDGWEMFAAVPGDLPQIVFTNFYRRSGRCGCVGTGYRNLRESHVVHGEFYG